MMNGHALPLLLQFIKAPGYVTASQLIHIPSVYNVLQYKISKSSQVNPKTLAMCKWLYVRAESVRRELVVHTTASPQEQNDDNSGDWRQAGCHYGMPLVQHRPHYPELKEEITDSASEQKGGC